MSTRNIVKNIRSNSVGTNGKPKLPTPSQLDYGEIAVNYKKGYETLSLKNDNNEIVSLSVNTIEDVKVNETSVVANKTANITMNGDTIPVAGLSYDVITYPSPFNENKNVGKILVDKKLSEALKILETNISALVTEVLDNEETSAAAIRKLAESAGTVDGSGNIGYQKAAGTTYISDAGSVHDATVKLDRGIYGLETRIGSAESDIRNLQGSIGQSSGIEWVDLGLPSGTYWAKCNLGATSESGYGDYYMWGSTTPNTDTTCNWTNAPFNGGASDYDSNYFNNVKDTVCPNGILAKGYDAAYKATEGIARMPTQPEFQELYDNTNKSWTAINSVNGMKFTSKTDSSKYIFIPAAGIRSDSSAAVLGSGGYVWSSSLYIENYNSAFHLDFGADAENFYPNAVSLRYKGLSVRPVKNVPK